MYGYQFIMRFELIENDTAYQLYFVNATVTDIIIPQVYNELPVTSIGDSAFSECAKITFLTIPNSITKIGKSAFSKCKSLTNITIPKSVTEIADETFSECHNLVNITFERPSSVKSIGDRAFTNCWSLKSIDIPESVISIGNEIFFNCFKLTKINIPRSVKYIGDEALIGCPIQSPHTIQGDLFFNDKAKPTPPKQDKSEYPYSLFKQMRKLPKRYMGYIGEREQIADTFCMQAEFMKDFTDNFTGFVPLDTHYYYN